MKVRLIPETSYRIETLSGDVLGSGFLKVSEWNDMVELKSPRYSLIASTHPPSILDGIFNDGPKPVEADVVKASPELIIAIKQSDVANTKAST